MTGGIPFRKPYKAENTVGQRRIWANRDKGRRPGHTQAAERAAKNVRLSKRATRLFMLYEDSGHGFRPALKHVEDQAGIPSNKISEIRKELVDHGLIWYGDGGEMVYLDWNRIRIFAMLEKPLPKKGQYAHVQTDDHRRTATMPMGEVYGSRAMAPDKKERAFYDHICGLTEVEFGQFLEYKPREQGGGTAKTRGT